MKQLKQIIAEGLFKNVGIGSEALKSKLKDWMKDHTYLEYASREDVENGKRSAIPRLCNGIYCINDNMTIDIYAVNNLWQSSSIKILNIPDYIKIDKLYVDGDLKKQANFGNMNTKDWASFFPNEIIGVSLFYIFRTNIDDKDAEMLIERVSKNMSGIGFSMCDNITRLEFGKTEFVNATDMPKLKYVSGEITDKRPGTTHRTFPGIYLNDCPLIDNIDDVKVTTNYLVLNMENTKWMANFIHDCRFNTFELPMLMKLKKQLHTVKKLDWFNPRDQYRNKIKELIYTKLELKEINTYG